MPRMSVPQEVRDTCYKNRNTYDYVHNQPRDICHHIDGNHDNNDPENLIWLSSFEHQSYHSSHRSAETLKKLSESAKRRRASPETRAKMSSSQKGRIHSEEARRKMSESQKGRLKGHWYNDGVRSLQAFECPSGFVRGRLPYKRKE